MKKIIIILMLIAVSISVSADPEIKGTPEELRQFLHPNENTVAITGEAEEKAYSDKAIVDLVITTKDKMLSTSLEQNSKLRETIRAELIKTGLSEDAIKSSKFSSSPQYGWFGKKPDSYQVNNHMAITITEESQLQAIAFIADSNKEIELASTIFEHSKKDEYKERVKKKAFDEILKQKEIYEKSLGLKLVPVGLRLGYVGQIRQGETGTGPEEFTLEEIVVTSEKRYSSYGPMSRSKDLEKIPIPSFDEIKYKATVIVEYNFDKTE